MDLLIKNGTIVTAKGSYKADVAVKDGKIAAIGKDLEVSATKVVDAKGKLGNAVWRNSICRQLSFGYSCSSVRRCDNSF